MRLTLQRVVVLVSMAATLVVAAWAGHEVFSPPPTPPSAIGGAFTLTDMQGRSFTDRNLVGRPTLIYFGFTYCPEICPTTLAHMTAWLRALGPDADRLNIVFVSVDPLRDTPAQLRLYLSNFDPRIVGLTGSEAAVAATARAYRVYYRKVPLTGADYTIDHSSAVYLLDRRARFVEPIRHEATDAEALAAIRRVLGR